LRGRDYVGCDVGALIAYLMRPDHAGVAIKIAAAGALDALGKVAATHLS